MKEQIYNCRIFWKKTASQGAKVLRFFADVPIAEIPSRISGLPVTEIGNYCFAPDCRISDEYLTADTVSSGTAVTALCGNELESIYLPDTLEKIGDYAFYNCRHLSDITFSNGLFAAGSDAFMNCHHLHHIFIKGAPMEQTSLRQILAQISWDAEVSFCKKNSPDPVMKEAVVFYPEYYEAYDEIAPAHIFGRKIIGEGFRARQCFHDGIIDFLQYDQIFKKACAEESERTLCRIAFDRLRYPYHLSDTGRIQYADYLLLHGEILCQQFVHDRRLNDLLFLFQENLLSQQDIQSAINLAAQAGWSEGSAAMLRWRQIHNHPHSRTRYEFEDF